MGDKKGINVVEEARDEEWCYDGDGNCLSALKGARTEKQKERAKATASATGARGTDTWPRNAVPLRGAKRHTSATPVVAADTSPVIIKKRGKEDQRERGKTDSPETV